MIYFLAIFLLWLHSRHRDREEMLELRVDHLNSRLSRAEEHIEELEKAVTPLPAPQIEFYTTQDGQKKRILFMILKVSQRLPVSVSVEFKDKFGNAAKVDGKPTWALTNDALGTVEASEDGLSATFLPSGQSGELALQVTADADLGEGVKSILGELPLELIAGDAETVSIAAGTPQDI